MMSPDYSRAAIAAYRVLARLEITTPPIRPLGILKRCRNTKVCTYDQAADVLNVEEDTLARMCGEVDAFTVVCGEGKERGYMVCYRAGGNPARLNFTLAHELGHIILRHEGKSDVEEKEADCFASHLLCPEPMLEEMRECGVEIIAHTFFVTRMAAEQVRRRKKCEIPAELLLKIQQNTNEKE